MNESLESEESFEAGNHLELGRSNSSSLMMKARLKSTPAKREQLESVSSIQSEQTLRHEVNESPSTSERATPSKMLEDQLQESEVTVTAFQLPNQEVSEPSVVAQSSRTNWYTLPSEDQTSEVDNEEENKEKEEPFPKFQDDPQPFDQAQIIELSASKKTKFQSTKKPQGPRALNEDDPPLSAKEVRLQIESDRIERENPEPRFSLPKQTETALKTGVQHSSLRPVKFSFFAQLGALFAKIKLEWVRGHVKSYSEYLFPITLFTFAAVLRVLMAPQKTEWTLDSFKQGSYPVGQVENGTWSPYNFTEKRDFIAGIQDFYAYTNYTNLQQLNPLTKQVEKAYEPEYDFVGPYFYYPMACYSKRGPEYSYPIIGYVKNDNPVERALIAQYQMVFKSQQDAGNMLSLVPGFLKKVGSAFGVDMEGGESTEILSFEQIIGKQGPQIPFEVIQYMGGVMKSDAEMRDVADFGDFKFMEFQSREDLNAYLAAPDYLTASKPGMCFAFSVTEEQNKYELEVFSNDKWPSIRRFSPDSELHEWLPFASMPFLAAYIQYVYNGYHLIENWTANIILQLKTKNPHAKIVSLLAPQKNKPLAADGFLVFLDSTFYYFIILMYFPLIFRTLYRITQERQNRCKDLMQSIGMRTFPYWFSWWCSYTLVNFGVTIVCATVAYSRIFHGTALGVLFVTFFLHGQAFFGLLWICSCLFESPQTACTLCLCLMWLMLLIEMPIDINQSWTPSTELKSMLCLFNPMLTIKQLMRVIVTFDNAKLPVNFENGWQLKRENFFVSQGVILLTFNTFFWGAVSLILEWALGDIEGKDRKCLCCMRKKVRNLAVYSCDEDQEFLHISKLEKEINGKKTLDCRDVKLPVNSIVAVCGPNGSGKTCFIEELRKSLTRVQAKGSQKSMFGSTLRLDIGMLPEQTILFDNLDPIDHLELAYRLKGDTPSLQERYQRFEVLQRLLQDLGFDRGSVTDCNFDKRASELSAADRRILQIAIAISTRSQVLLLDDPFGGLDTHQVQCVTKALGAYIEQGNELGNHCLIVYTTRFPQDAEKLGDRVIFLDGGKQVDWESATKIRSHLSDSRLFQQKNFSFVSQTTTANTSQAELLQDQSAFEGDGPKKKQAIENEWFHDQPSEQAQQQDPSDGQQMAALIIRRLQQINTTRKPFLIQLLVPILVITFGYFACRTFITLPSPSRLISPDYYDGTQEILANKIPVDIVHSDQYVREVMDHLPGLGSTFDLRYTNTSVAKDFYTYQNEIYEKDLSSASSNYGSYLFYRINKNDHQYQVVSFVNSTEFTSSINFPAFLYEAILKSAVGEPDFGFKIRSTPYPLRPEHKQVLHRSSRYVDAFNFFTVREYIWNKVNLAQGPIFVLSGAYVIMVTFLIHHVTQERLSKMKLLQQVSGLKLKAYWIGNYLFDVASLLLLMTVNLVLFVAFDPIWRASLVVYFAWPFMTVPFAYGFSFLFQDLGATQFLPITVLLFAMLCLCHLTFGLRILSQFEFIGDVLTWVLRGIPNFPLANTLYTEAATKDLQDLRKFTKEKDSGTAQFGSENVWSVFNCSGDVLSLIWHFIFWTALIYAIERDETKRIKAACRRRDHQNSQPEAAQPDADLSKGGIYVHELAHWTSDLNLNRNDSFQDVTFVVKRGEIMTLVSSQQAKKTTLIRVLIHDLVPNKGHVSLSGIDMSTVHGDYLNRMIGYAPCEICLFETLTVWEHLVYFAAIKGIDETIEIEALLKHLSLEKAKDIQASLLSVGNRRLLQIAIALLGRPKTIIIDGAFDGLDCAAARHVCSLLQKACVEWKSAVLVGVSVPTDELIAISGQVGVVDNEGDQLFASLERVNDNNIKGKVI